MEDDLSSVDDINECESGPCVHGSCNDNVNGYMCSCTGGYTGNQCQSEQETCLIYFTAYNFDVDFLPHFAFCPSFV